LCSVVAGKEAFKRQAVRAVVTVLGAHVHVEADVVLSAQASV
jgi:hypothetical protein